MLNELRDLARSLKKAGIGQEDWHSKFKKCPKYKGFWVYPSVGGRVERIEPVGSGIRLDDLRKWERNQGWSFPVFNVSPLYLATDRKMVAEMKKRIGKNETFSEVEINATIAKCNSLWDENTEAKVENSVQRTAGEVKDMLSDVPAKFRALSDLIGRAEKMNFNTLRDDVKRLTIEGLSAGKIEFFDILFQGPANVQFILELHDWAEQGYEYPATHREVQKWMNGMFLAHGQKMLEDVPSSTDAFGEDAAGKDEQKFPEVRLPVLGNVKLRSMFKDIPAQTRYGMIEAESFPAGDKVRKEMKSALEWLSNNERKGKTWCDLTKRTNKATLLFAYPTEMPGLAPELAGLLGGTDDNAEDPDGVRFSAIAGRVTETLKGIARGRPDSDIRIFVLAKMDKARTKVLASRRYTAKHMIDAAEHWQEGCRNIPVIRVRQFGKEKGKTLWSEPIVPFPAELVWCLNTAWRRQRTYAEAVHGYSINDALSLLLDEGHETQRLALRAIDTIVRNSSPLILAVGQENHFARVFIIDRKFSKQPVLLPSIMGLLLYKLNIDMKGGYMSSPAFLVGQFMSLADKLHLKYCEHVRKNQIPPQLVGNALMSTALEEPVKALSMLSQRILPYQAWANTMKEGEDIGLVRYFLGQLGEVSDKLKDLDIPSQCTHAEKAQILLGYLAWPEKASD